MYVSLQCKNKEHNALWKNFW